LEGDRSWPLSIRRGISWSPVVPPTPRRDWLRRSKQAKAKDEIAVTNQAYRGPFLALSVRAGTARLRQHSNEMRTRFARREAFSHDPQRICGVRVVHRPHVSGSSISSQ